MKKHLQTYTKRETMHIWLPIIIAGILTCCWLSVELIVPRQSQNASQTTWAGAVIVLMPHLLFLCLLMLLFVAFRRWHMALRRQRELETIFASITPNVMLIVKPDRTIVMCNRAVEDLFGHQADEVIGKCTDLLYTDRRLTGQKGEIYNAIKTIGFHIGTATGRHKDGHTMPLELVTSGIIGQQGAIVLIRDITERKIQEEEILRAKTTAEEGERVKSKLLADIQQNYVRLKDLEDLRDDFTHMVVHDLRSPLSSIAKCLALLETDARVKLSDTEMLYLREAFKLTRYLSDMISSLLDVARLESKEMPIKLETCDLMQLAAMGFETMGPEVSEKNIEVACPTEPITVACDREIILRVFVNLIANAVKFTPQGGCISIEAQRTQDEVRVTVSDTGRGIPAEFHQKIFDRFFQVETRKYSSGIGLTFCKMAIEAHNGRIGVESEIGKGSSFWFVLPVRAIPRKPA